MLFFPIFIIYVWLNSPIRPQELIKGALTNVRVVYGAHLAASVEGLLRYFSPPRPNNAHVYADKTLFNFTEQLIGSSQQCK